MYDENNNFSPDIPPQDNGKKFAIAALVCGILGIVGGWFPIVCYFTFVLSILGIIFGVKGMKDCPQGASGRGLAIAGLVCGIVGVAFSLVGVLCYSCAACAVCSAGGLSSLYY